MASKRGTSITHIITGLNVGGAEVMLLKLLKAIDRQRFPSRVISLTDIGEIGKRIIDAGVSVTSIGMKPGSFSFTGVQKLVDEISKQKPVIVQTWMYHADLLGGWAARKAGVDYVAWNIRNSTLDWRKSKLTTQATVRMCAVLSHSVPDRIVVCSSAAAEVHGKVGYDREKFQVIPNGFDLEVFKSDREAGMKLRKENNLDLESTSHRIGRPF